MQQPNWVIDFSGTSDDIPIQQIPEPEAETFSAENSLSAQKDWLIETLHFIRETAEGLALTAAQEIDGVSSGEVPLFRAELPTDFALTLSSATCDLNNLLYAYFQSNWFNPQRLLHPARTPAARAAAEQAAQQVRLAVHPNRVLVYLPYLPEKGDHDTAIINDMLFSKLTQECDLPNWKSIHIHFLHCYPKNTVSLPRDLDNYNYKRTIDLLCFALRCSDSPVSCSLQMTPFWSEKHRPGVYIEITPKSSDFSDFEFLSDLSAAP